jgi:hypothetical protein
VTAADCRWLRPLLEPVIERATTGSFGRDLLGVDRAELAAAARELLAAKPLTFSELGRALARTPGTCTEPSSARLDPGTAQIGCVSPTIAN